MTRERVARAALIVSMLLILANLVACVIGQIW